MQGGISRRQFLEGTAAAGVGLAVAPLIADASAEAQTGPGTPPTAVPNPDVPPVQITLNINGTDHTLSVEPRVTLLDALRERLRLTGTKKGCDLGQCGACTVHVNGRRTLSCLTLAVMHQGDRITTIEGLAQGDTLHPVQAAFIEHDSFQCGYCTPGQIMSAAALLEEGHAGTPEEIRELMSGNICRCGAYEGIVAAIQQVLEAKRHAAL
jgi:xanthine dehydrogenase YagT iron-sulfur-binding subunit